MSESLRDALKRHGLWANKSLGQHFLLDPSITGRIAAVSGVGPGQTVIEVGPGPGGLTRALLAAGVERVIAIEKDPRFLPLLSELAQTAPGRLCVVKADALTVDEPALLAAAGTKRAAIVANLPYNVGTPLLVKWLKAGPWRSAMTLMFQKEVAERITAHPAEPAYGRLAVLTQARCHARKAIDIAAGAFVPPPKVASAVVCFENRTDPYPDLAALETITAAAFGRRRKMLRSALRALALPQAGDVEGLLRTAGLDPSARAETIPPDGFFRLADALRATHARAVNS